MLKGFSTVLYSNARRNLTIPLSTQCTPESDVPFSVNAENEEKARNWKFHSEMYTKIIRKCRENYYSSIHEIQWRFYHQFLPWQHLDWVVAPLWCNSRWLYRNRTQRSRWSSAPKEMIDYWHVHGELPSEDWLKSQNSSILCSKNELFAQSFWLMEMSKVWIFKSFKLSWVSISWNSRI